EFNDLPRWFQRIIPLISVILSVLVFSYVMYLYNQESLEFMQWIRLIIFTIMGVVSILSAIVYVFNAELAWKWLIGGLGLRSEEHTSELQSRFDLVCRLLLEKKKKKKMNRII